MPTFGLLDTGFNPKRFTDVQTSIVAGIRSAPGLSRLNLGRETFLGGVVAAISEAVAEMWELSAELFAAGDPDTATGRALDNLCAITGTVRKPPTPTRVACTVNLDVGTYPAGSLIANPVGRADLQYTNVATLVRTGSTGNVTAIFQATTDGAIPCPATTLQQIASPVVGWNSITNADDGIIGTDLETDAALRVRRVKELLVGGGSTAEAIERNLLRKESLLVQVFVFENDLDTPTTIVGHDFPGHSFMTVVYDGTASGTNVSDAAIAQYIWDERATGIATVGDLNATVTDINGTPQTVRFQRPAQVAIFVDVTVVVAAGGVIADVRDAVKTALAAYAAAYQCGSTVVYALLFGPVGGVAGVADITALTVDTSSSPTGVVNIAMTSLQIAHLPVANIRVNGS